MISERIVTVKYIRVSLLIFVYFFFTAVLRAETESPNDSLVNHQPIGTDVKIVFSEGIIFGKFSKEDGPFLLESSVIVPSGQILEFGPGCKILIGGQHINITVYGQIFVRGQKDEPVEFISGKESPNPWDWGRIYCRNEGRSVFEHCIIRHSNYGIFVENGAATIKNCTFDQNSLYGLVIKNSEVDLYECHFTGGHVNAISLLPGAVCNAESLIVNNNMTGISCHKGSRLNLQRGYILDNTNGIIADPASSVSIVVANITKNRNGILSTKAIPRKSREVAFGNGYDLKVVNQYEFDKITSIAEVESHLVLPQKVSAKSNKPSFVPGFSASQLPPEPVSDFLGNITTGFKYFHPKSFINYTDDSTYEQTHYPEGFQPEVQIFANGNRSGAEVNLLMDIYGNNWLSPNGYVGKRMFNLSLSYAQQQLTFGDFFETSSETSISGRQVTGIKYSGQFLEMGAGKKRLEVMLAAGESEIPKDSGDHDINIYNETIDTGMSVRQQLTYLASFSVKPAQNVNITAKGIIARDQTEKPLFRAPINDPAAPDPIEAQTGSIDATVGLLNGKLELFAELDLGVHDTIDDEKYNKIAWYNPDFKNVLPKIFSLFGKDDFLDHYAFTIGGKTSINGYQLTFSGSQIAADYFSAGNPYLDVDRRSFTVSSEKTFSEKLTVGADYDYRKSSRSQNPADNNTANLRAEYTMGEFKPTFSTDYTLQFEKVNSSERVEKDDTSYSATYKDKALRNILALEAKQSFLSGIDYGIRYQFLYDNDVSIHADSKQKDSGDRFQNQLRAWFAFRLLKHFRNKTTIRLANRDEKRDDLQAFSYKLQNQTNWNIVPRKLSMSMLGEYSNSEETDIYSKNNPTLINFYKGEMEIKYSINSRFSLSAMGSYEKGYDETPGSAENYTAIISGVHLTCLF